MHRFRRPLIVTGITLLAALILGIGGATWIYHSNISDRRKTERAGMLGKSVGVISLVVIAPFWVATAARVGKERREK